jgi:hypothetical protein
MRNTLLPIEAEYLSMTGVHWKDHDAQEGGELGFSKNSTTIKP